jgi:aryl-alcohol dehydrogenase-like predicted oxidoreductase
VEELAKKKGVTMAQIGLAWSLGSEHVTAPIVGTTKLENLKELIGAFARAFLQHWEKGEADCSCS